MTQRIPLVPLEEAQRLCAEAGLPERMGHLSAFRTLAHNPDLMKAVFGQLMTLMNRNRLDTRLRELMIYRPCRW